MANGRQKDARVRFSVDGCDVMPSPAIKVLGMDIDREFDVNKTQWKRARKARAHLWMLLKAREFYASTKELEVIYKSYIRSHMEVNVPVSLKALSGKVLQYMESTQKKALR